MAHRECACLLLTTKNLVGPLDQSRRYGQAGIACRLEIHNSSGGLQGLEGEGGRILPSHDPRGELAALAPPVEVVPRHHHHGPLLRLRAEEGKDR